MAPFDRPRPGQPGYFAAPATRPETRLPRQGGYDPYSDLGPSPMWGMDQPNPFEGNPMMQHINPSRHQQDVLNRAYERFGLEPRGASPYMDSPLQPEGIYYDDMDYEDPYATGGEFA